jgi:hypothetical protein
MDYLEFIARVTSHIPDKGQVMVRYYGLYANTHSCLRAGGPDGGRGKRGPMNSGCSRAGRGLSRFDRFRGCPGR